jgi:hypothetical protein
MKFSTTAKLDELERELKYRHHVFKKLVDQRKMSLDTAQRRIAILTEIADEYRERVGDGPLFERERDA